MNNAVGSVADRIAAHLEADAPALVHRLVSTYRRNPGYSGLDDALYEADLAPVAAANLRLLTQRLRGLRQNDEDVAIVAESGARRMTQGVPEAEVGRAYRLWSMAVWTEITEAARALDDVDAEDVVPLASVVLEHNEYAGGLAADAYEGESRGIWVQATALADVTMDELVNGSAEREQVDSLRLQCFGDGAPAMVTLLAITTRERGPGVTSGNAIVRQVVESWRRVTDSRVFVGVMDRAVFLIGTPSDSQQWHATVGAFGLRQVAMVQIPEIDDLQTALLAIPEASELLSAARILPARRTPYTHRETVLAALGIASPPGIAGRLKMCRSRIADYEAARGAPLRQTLHAFLESGESVSRTAEVLYCHPNTVRHRLGVIARLTGLDPALFVDRALLAIALSTTPAVGERKY